MALQEIQKPKVERSIAVYTLDANARAANINALVGRIESHLHILRGLHIKGFLISLEGVTSIEAEALELLIQALTRFHGRLKVVAGFCNYSNKLFNILVPIIEKTPLALFKTKEMMALAIGTSGVFYQATILVHADDSDNRQSIASTLISNSYSVVMANSLDDFKEKIQDRDRYESYVMYSYFGFMYESAIIMFSNGAYIYEFRGDLNSDLVERINVKDFESRLALGHKIFVFNLTKIFHMDMKAALLLLEMEKLAIAAGAQVCLVNVDRTKIDNNAFSILGKSGLWIFDDIDEVFEDEDIIELVESRKKTLIRGLSTATVKMAPHLIAAGIQTLELYEFKNIDKSPSKQIKLKDIAKLKPTICTGISFDGDFDGEYIFVFNQGITELLLEHILGGLDGVEGEDLLDAMSEFTNSVTGKLKTNLHKREKCIHFDLPDSKALLTDIVPDEAMNNPAILMSFACEGQEFYIALTSPFK